MKLRRCFPAERNALFAIARIAIAMSLSILGAILGYALTAERDIRMNGQKDYPIKLPRILCIGILLSVCLLN